MRPSRSGSRVTIAPAHFALSSFTQLIHVFMSSDIIAIFLQYPDLLWHCKRTDDVTSAGGEAIPVIHNSNVIFADQISHGVFIWSADRDSISRHEWRSRSGLSTAK